MFTWQPAGTVSCLPTLDKHAFKTSIASQRLGKYISRSNERAFCMTARKINCSTKGPLDGTRRATLRGLLEDCNGIRIRLPGGRTLRSECCTEWEPVENEYRARNGWRILRYCRIENIIREGITKKNLGVRIEDREADVFRFRGVRLCKKWSQLRLVKVK
jgi:hypothetical protein